MLSSSSLMNVQEGVFTSEEFVYEKILSTQLMLPSKETEFLQFVNKIPFQGVSKSLKPIEGAINEIIFESEIDGYCYYLVRSKPQKNSRHTLSPRELEIAELIAQGLSNKAIAEMLELSPWTVATYLRRMFTKLKVSSRAALVAKLAL